MASLGSWLEQVWTRLGGPLCVDATARANLELLWRRSTICPRASKTCSARPSMRRWTNYRAARSRRGQDCGVQLMTIHKSKGLEFEVVIVPELQALSGKADTQMLSWLERGLAEADDIRRTHRVSGCAAADQGRRARQCEGVGG